MPKLLGKAPSVRFMAAINRAALASARASAGHSFLQCPLSTRPLSVADMIPRFANPFALQQSTQIVSRADLDSDHESVSGTDDTGPNSETVALLENMLKRSLGNVDASHESEPRKKRRKKVDAEDAVPAGSSSHTLDGVEYNESDEAVEFRLLSTSTKLVSLKPKPAPEIKVKGPSLEDDDAEAALRAERARAAAVDFAWIVAESQKPYYPRVNDSKKITVVTANEPLTSPMAVLAVPRPTPRPNPNFTIPLNMPPKELPNPHDFPAEKICCPVVTVEPSPAESVTNRRKRSSRHKKLSAEPRPPPSFWRPQQEWGGKSRGYAMGYEGSRPVPTGSVRQWKYRRDRLKKGVFCA